MDTIVLNNIKNYLNNINQFNSNNETKNATIECRKLFDYISLNLIELKISIKFLNTIKQKLIDLEGENINNINIFYPLFYKKLLFPEEFGKLSYKEIKIFVSSRNKYYQEDLETKKYFNQIQNSYNVYYSPNLYIIPKIVYI